MKIVVQEKIFKIKIVAVKIVIFVLLVLFAVAGVVWYLRSSDEEPKKDSLEVFPQLGEGSLIRFRPSDGRSVWNVTKAIDEVLKRK